MFGFCRLGWVAVDAWASENFVVLRQSDESDEKNSLVETDEIDDVYPAFYELFRKKFTEIIR